MIPIDLLLQNARDLARSKDESTEMNLVQRTRPDMDGGESSINGNRDNNGYCCARSCCQRTPRAAWARWRCLCRALQKVWEGLGQGEAHQRPTGAVILAREGRDLRRMLVPLMLLEFLGSVVFSCSGVLRRGTRVQLEVEEAA